MPNEERFSSYNTQTGSQTSGRMQNRWKKYKYPIRGVKQKHTLRVEHKSFIWESLALMYSMKASPATASIRLIPDAMPCSEMILKARISEVLLTWVPPQSSMDTPGTSTTRTYNTSAYKLGNLFPLVLDMVG